MTLDKTQLAINNDLTKPLGIAGKTITSVSAYRHGSVEVIDILCTDTVHYYAKCSQGRIETGGTVEWGTGTQLGGR